MNVGLTLGMPTDAKEIVAVGESVLPMRASLCGTVSEVVQSYSGVGYLGGNKTRLIVINGNINVQTYINDVLAVEALPFIQIHGPNVIFMHDDSRPHSAAITRQFFATNNVNVLDLPMNSPDLNLIEQVWDESGRHVRKNHAIHTVNDLAAALQAEWANFESSVSFC